MAPLREAGLTTLAISHHGATPDDDAEKVKAFLERAADDGFGEICFKELYVSSISENPWAASAPNRFCEENQVPLQS